MSVSSIDDIHTYIHTYIHKYTNVNINLQKCMTVSSQKSRIPTPMIGNMTEDDWRWHMYDTVKGSDWLGDQVTNPI